MKTYSESFKSVLLYQGAANAVSCDVVSCKNANKVTFEIIHTGANNTDLTLSLYEATDVAAGTNAAVATACPIYIDINAGTTSDGLTRTTDAYSYVIDPATMNGVMVHIEWDPAKHTAGYDCIYLSAPDGHANNICTITAKIDYKFKGAAMPTAITD